MINDGLSVRGIIKLGFFPNRWLYSEIVFSEKQIGRDMNIKNTVVHENMLIALQAGQ
jgi:hypothetical protein